MTRGRYVICGPQGAGKSTFVKKHARLGDYRWDLDHVAACLTIGTPVLPAELKGHLPLPTYELVLQLRETFLTRVGTVGQLGDARVFVIVHDIEVARVIAHELHARLIQINHRHEVNWRAK